MKNQHIKQSILAMAVLGISFFGTSIARAAVTKTGDTSYGSQLQIGQTGVGSMTIDQASQVSVTGTTIARMSGSNGTLTISGPGSSYICSSDTEVAYSGTGYLYILNGASSYSNSAYFGYGDGGVGTGMITGEGSTLTVETNLGIGNFGRGSVTIANGGKVDVKASGATAWSIGLGWLANSQGELLITGAGSTVNAQELSIIGRYGQGFVSVEDGGQLNTDITKFAYMPTGTGTATVTGAGSTWNSNTLILNNTASSLTVADGGIVNTKSLYASLDQLHGNGTIRTNGGVLDATLAIDATHGTSQSINFGTGGTLQLNIDGASDLGAGFNTTGTLQIADGLSIVSASGYLGYNAGSTGTATVTGPGSSWTLTQDLNVGYNGSGQLIVKNGAHLITKDVFLARNSGSTGSVVLTGESSKWTARSIATAGPGSLTVSNGATLITQGLMAGLPDILGNGTIYSSGAVLDIDMVIDANHGTLQSLAFGNGGTLNLDLNSTGTLGTGYRSTGTLRIADGRKVTSAASILGYTIDSTGRATVRGTGTTWDIAGSLIVGNNGNGFLTIEDGAQVTSNEGYLGRYIPDYLHTAQGTVTVRGVGSSWTTDYLNLGYGNSTLIIQDGAHVSSQRADMGFSDTYTASNANIMVSGPSSTWDNAGTIAIINAGHGAINITNGGRVTAQSVVNKSPFFMIRTLVSNDGMLVLGDADHVGSLTTSATIQLIADPHLSAGTYRPITEYAGRDLSIAFTTPQSGWVNPLPAALFAIGGSWDATAKTFTVNPTKSLASSVSQKLISGDRLLITDATTGDTIGASFGAITGTVNFSASKMTEGNLASLTSLISDGQSILDGWNFTTSLTGQTALLSYDLGTGYDNLQLWHLVGSTWSAYTPGLQSYDANGILSFDVTSFSGYAVTGTLVPEPATFGLLGLASLGLLRRRRMV